MSQDTEFVPAHLDGRFTHCADRGLTAYCKIFSSKSLGIFEQLTDKYHLDKQDFFRYLQLRHYFDKTIKPNDEEGMYLINVFIDAYKGKIGRKLISRIYLALQQNRGHSTLYIKTKWEKDADITLTEDDWSNICRTLSTTTASGMWREFLWKNIVRFFITPKIKAAQSNNPNHGRCWRECGNQSADHFHVFWGCPKISTYWSNVITKIRSMLDLDLDHSFSVIYLGNVPAILFKTR